jgi:predicted RNA polymerase sigma factor
MVGLNRAVAVAMVRGPDEGPAAGLALLDRLADPLAGHYPARGRQPGGLTGPSARPPPGCISFRCVPPRR